MSAALSDPAAIAEIARARLAPLVREGLDRWETSLVEEQISAGLVRDETLRALNVAATIAEARANAKTPAIDPPNVVLITGLGRTGSTFLHNLLACDPGMRAPALWELWHPLPEPTARGQTLRIGLAHARLRTWSSAQRALHPMHAELPDECYWIMPHQHCHALAYNARSYCAWLGALSNEALCSLYQDYRDYVCAMTAGFPGKTWLGKCLAHMHYAPILHRLFPRARLIRLHRNPVDAFASYCGLLGAFANARLSGRNPFRSSTLALGVLAESARRMLQTDRSILCADVLYDDLIGDPGKTVASIYDQLGLTHWQDMERDIARLSAAPRTRPPRTPSLAEIGVAARAVHETMADYYAWAESRWGKGVWA